MVSTSLPGHVADLVAEMRVCDLLAHRGLCGLKNVAALVDGFGADLAQHVALGLGDRKCGSKQRTEGRADGRDQDGLLLEELRKACRVSAASWVAS